MVAFLQIKNNTTEKEILANSLPTKPEEFLLRPKIKDRNLSMNLKEAQHS